MAMYRLPGSVLLVGVGCHDRRRRIHDVTKCGALRRREHPLDPGDAHQPVALEHRNRHCALETFSPHIVERLRH